MSKIIKIKAFAIVETDLEKIICRIDCEPNSYAVFKTIKEANDFIAKDMSPRDELIPIEIKIKLPNKTPMKKTPKETKGKETLKEKMVKAGYPYCYRIKGVDRHCESCIKYYKLRIKREKLMGITSP